MKKIAIICIIALFLGCLAPSAFAFNIPSHPLSPIVFQLVGFETFGSLDLLSDLLEDSPGETLSFQIVLNPDGTYRYDYRYNDQTATSSGAWSATMNSYVLEWDDGSELTVLRDSHGYYVLALEGYNVLLATEDSIENGIYSTDDIPDIVPDNIADFDLPFKGSLQEHREAVDFVSDTLENVSIQWQDDIKLASDLSCAQFTVSTGDQIRIVYSTSTEEVYAYVFSEELSDLDTGEVSINKLIGSSQLSIPILSVMWIDCDKNESAYIDAINGSYTYEYAASFCTLLGDVLDGNNGTIDYYGYKLSIIRESDGYSHPIWFVLHSPTDNSDTGFSSAFGGLING